MADCVEQDRRVGGVPGIDACDCAVASGSSERGGDGMVELLAIRSVEDRAEDRGPERPSDHAERLKDAGRDATALVGDSAERGIDRRRQHKAETEA